MSRLRAFVAELFRRKVVRLLGAYIAIFWLLAQGFASLFPVLGLPDWLLRAFIIAGTVAIPVLAFLSWKYDLVPPQLVRDTKDVEAANPMLLWANHRHDSAEAGHLLLHWNGEDGAPKERRFFRPLSVGREPSNDVTLPDQCVSRHHAVLWAEGGAWHIRDLDSTDGTFVDETRVSGTAPVPNVCELRFHRHGPAVKLTVEKPLETVVRTEY
jgi:FHA domain